MRIGELAANSGVGVETVRYYEKKGLIEQPPRPWCGGYRDYSDEAVRRIHFIRRAQKLGFSLSEVGDLLDLEADVVAGCADIRERAQAKRRAVQDRIDQLERIRNALDRLIGACPGAGPARTCSIIEVLSGEGPFLKAMKRGQTNGRKNEDDRDL